MKFKRLPLCSAICEYFKVIKWDNKNAITNTQSIIVKYFAIDNTIKPQV